jgi:hypothetical protein
MARHQIASDLTLKAIRPGDPRQRDSLGRAYNRTEFIDQRRKMLQAWADYLDKLRLDVNATLRTLKGEAVHSKRARRSSLPERLPSH